MLRAGHREFISHANTLHLAASARHSRIAGIV
jgi:hypothetical protein